MTALSGAGKRYSVRMRGRPSGVIAGSIPAVTMGESMEKSEMLLLLIKSYKEAQSNENQEKTEALRSVLSHSAGSKGVQVPK